MTSGRYKKKKTLSANDRMLWQRVTTTLTPLHPEGEAFNKEDLNAYLEPEKTQDEQHPVKAARREAKAHVSTQALLKPTPPSEPSPPPLVHMDRKKRKKIAKAGGRHIDARLDLHGLTQGQAHDRLRGFLHQAQMSGYTLVLVITGKGSAKGFSFGDERGVLRRMVPQWLSLPDFRRMVLGFEQAHISHGGDGAIYVQIRKRRDGSRDYT